MNIDPVKFVNIEHDSFRELETVFTEKFFSLIDCVKSGKLTDDNLVNFHSEIMQAITTTEEQIISPLLEQASREKLAEIFKTETNTCKTV